MQHSSLLPFSVPLHDEGLVSVLSESGVWSLGVIQQKHWET